jgi:hypothetical protein
MLKKIERLILSAVENLAQCGKCVSVKVGDKALITKKCQSGESGCSECANAFACTHRFALSLESEMCRIVLHSHRVDMH